MPCYLHWSEKITGWGVRVATSAAILVVMVVEIVVVVLGGAGGRQSRDAHACVVGHGGMSFRDHSAAISEGSP